MNAVTIEDARLPRLGWVARVDPAIDCVTVTHGSGVERGQGWIVEGVWDGPFGDSFPESEHFFGSGVRVRGDSVVFVPSCAVVDRIVWAETDGAFVASNSLALLLASTGGRLRAEDGAAQTIYALRRGIDAYDDRIPTSSGTVHQLFYHNLDLTNGARTLGCKAQPREIASYEEYSGLLTQAVERLARNLSDPSRRIPVRPLATISRGYDSPTVCALARAAGLRTCYTRARSNSIIPALLNRVATDDDGTVVARALGLDARALDAGARDELHFLAGSDESALAFGSMAREIEATDAISAVFTGYHGDTVWKLVHALDDARAPAIIRKNTSGMDLSEVRLKAGFLNVALPFLHVRSLASIARISRSDQMRPWRTWTKYDRPIPRRLLVEAGVDGSLFGQRKKAIVSLPALPTDPTLRREFLDAVREQTGYVPSIVLASARLDDAMTVPFAAGHFVGVRRRTFIRPVDIRSRLYVWAVNRLASQYAAVMPERLEPGGAAVE